MEPIWINGPGGGAIACIKYGRAIEVRKANAHLIAAAPELLDAVKCLRQHLALFCTPSDSVAAEIFNLVDGVIAKATAP